MKAKLVIFPIEDGFQVVVWGVWAEGSIRARSFDNRATMIALLQNLQLIDAKEAQGLEQFTFLNSCPLYSAEIDDEILKAHGFHKA
jgi:hypothetical protein